MTLLDTAITFGIICAPFIVITVGAICGGARLKNNFRTASTARAGSKTSLSARNCGSMGAANLPISVFLPSKPKMRAVGRNLLGRMGK